MKKKIKSIAIALIVVGLAFLYAHIDKNTYLYDRNTELESYVQTGVLQKGETISQTFLCSEEVLDGINLKSTIVGSADNVSLEYAITDNETGQITKGTVKGTEIKNNKFNEYSFPRIEGAKDKSYTLTLSETGADLENGVSFYIDSTKTKESLSVKGQVTQGSLVVRLTSHRFDMETFIVLLGFIVFVVAFIKVLYGLFE